MLEREQVSRLVSELKLGIIKESHPLENLLLMDGPTVKAYSNGEYFGERDHYYLIQGEVMFEELSQGESYHLHIYSSLNEWDNTTNPQMKVYLNQQLIQALDVNHQQVRVPKEFVSKGKVDFKLEIYSGREEKQFPLYLFLQKIDCQTEKVYFDFWVALESWRAIVGNQDQELLYQKPLKSAINQLDFRQRHSADYYNGLKKAEEILKTQLYETDYFVPATIAAVAHTHIDLAWLWTMKQAVEKGERSFSTVLRLMEEDEGFYFLQSQPQMYEFIKEAYPALYKKIKAEIIAGRWEPEGAMWVEADCNLTSGESLVRQILYGKRFMKEEFNQESQILWLPDVFGYSAALPQILKKTNTPYFMTTKLSWNQFNQIPYDTFYWQGIDGSEVLTHFITTISEGYSPTPYYTTYNGILDPYSVKGSWDRYQQKEFNEEVLIAYGYGDGGGGPTSEMLETAKRLENGLPGIPRVVHSSGNHFFKKLEHTVQNQKLPRWMGELYFEYHRGTYTSIAKIKKNNRQSEYLLQTVEKLYGQFGFSMYPHQELEILWKLVLRNQFHDILPGSAIKEVYDQTDSDYDKVFKKSKELVNNLFGHEEGPTFYIYNPVSKERTTTIKLTLKANQVVTLNNQPLVTQKMMSGETLVEIPHLPSLGGQIIEVKESPTENKTNSQPKEAGSIVGTPFYQVRFNEAYEIISLYDKQTQREIVPTGMVLNQLVAYEDLPLNFDAWDIDYYYQEKSWFIQDVHEVKLLEDGPLRQTLKIKRQFEASTITQYIHFYQKERRIDFETEVDWHQSHILLKAEFPVEINTLKGTFDIQFGNVERPVHQNTSWEQAKFEVCGQKWIDLSEGNYGVSLITDSKYGFNVGYKKMAVSLIKSATNPYPEADQGNHSFTYALFPHKGNWQEGQTIDEANQINVPPMILPLAKPQLNTEKLTQHWCEISDENIILDTIKKSEDQKKLIIRLYETMNCSTIAKISINEQIEKATICDLLENDLSEISRENNTLIVSFKPFEIQTVKLYLA